MLARKVAEEEPEPVNVARKVLMAYSVLNGFKQIFWDGSWQDVGRELLGSA